MRHGLAGHENEVSFATAAFRYAVSDRENEPVVLSLVGAKTENTGSLHLFGVFGDSPVHTRAHIVF